MHLKTLSLAGFKSFADRTRLEFEPGVTVVVGPNGSGKSNLVDALAWVMGTQATRSLRTQKMEDVIFAGTALRPPHTRSEVSLTFDNAQRVLALDLSEVTLTRRLFRDGTSEYEINGTPCRLLDIQELLSDSGVGRHQHVIVGQGRVDAVLNAGPEEHRAVIEEAAGVIKHRARRDRAVRRLEATDGDVVRLQDLLSEQQRRMRPLKRQARAAERHDEVKAAWRSLRLWVGAEQLRTVRGRAAEVAQAQESSQTELSRAEADRAEIATRLPALQAEAGEVGEALERDTAAAARLETAAERLQRIAMVAKERRVALVSKLEGADERRADLDSERADLEERLAEAGREEGQVAAAAERFEAELRALDDEERSLAEQETLPAEGVTAALRGDLGALEAADQRDARESEALANRRATVAARLDEEDVERNRLNERIQEGDARLAPLQDAYAAAEAARVRDQRILEEAEAAAGEARVQLAASDARAEAIEAALEGAGDPEARRIAEHRDGILGTVVSRLDVPEYLAAAVDAALGTWSDALVASDGEALVAAVEAVKSAGTGGVGIGLGAASMDFRAAKIAAATGLDPLVDLLGPDADRGLAAAFLGDVIVVEGWATGLELVRRHPDVRVVTPEGDVITESAVRVAHPDGAGFAALEAALVAVEQAKTTMARTTSRLTSARRAFEESRSAERAALEALEKVETEIAGATEALALVDRSRSEAQAEIERIDARLEALRQAEITRAERLAELRSRLAAFEGEEAARQQAWEALAKRRADVTRRRDDARRRTQEAAAALAAVRERKTLLERRLVEVTQLSLDLDGAPVDPGHIERLEIVEDRARHAFEIARRRVVELRDRQRELRATLGEAGTRLDEAYAAKDVLDERIGALRERLSGLAVEAAELRLREEAAAEGLRRDVDADEETALAAPRPEFDDDVDPVERLESLDKELRRLGPVNPLAAAEYKELEERALFLQEQLADLDESRSEMRKVIAALDEEIGRLFSEAFAEIAAMYEENFGLLFPGGTGTLTLTDPDDPLTSGVDIAAQPLGKKVSKLSLLSGGERSLAALAFLFAVFRARPSPFYVLDEVEAALDDANLRRFLRLVDTLRDRAQLVIITHQQQTMEVADLLYGVTMEPGESSTVLAKRLDRV